jgi:hypothetical protein
MAKHKRLFHNVDMLKISGLSESQKLTVNPNLCMAGGALPPPRQIHPSKKAYTRKIKFNRTGAYGI